MPWSAISINELNTRIRMKQLDVMSYRRVNEAFHRRMVYHVGVDCGFFVEMNYMINAMLTGHDGSLSTGHSNSVPDMLLRLEMMIASAGEQLPVDSIRRRIASALDIVIHLGRLRDKSRRVLEITEVLGYEKGEILLNPLFRFEESGEEKGRVVGTLKALNTLKRREKLQMAGKKLPEKLFMSG